MMMLSPVQICMDSTDWPQSMMQERGGFRGSAATGTEDLLSCSRPLMERGMKPQPEQALKCPRCESTNTKFCYYNNYSLSQPRHFCKTCRRYWTKGGALRTVPVGGGCRKNKKAKRAVVPDSATLNDPSTSSANVTALSIVNPAANSANTNMFFSNSTNTGGLSDINAAAAFARVHQQAALANCNNPDFLGLSCGPSNPQSSFGLTLNPINLSALNALHSLKSTFPSLANDFPVVNSNKSSTDQGSSSSSLIPPSEWQLVSDSNLFAADSNNFWSGGSVWPDLTSYIASSSSM